MYELSLSKDTRILRLSNIQIQGPADSIVVDMILDTGAFFSVISWNMAVQMGFRPHDEKNVSILTANGTIQVPFIRMKQLKLMNVSAFNILTVCHDIPEMMNDNCGILGLGGLKNLRTLIDFRSLKLKID